MTIAEQEKIYTFKEATRKGNEAHLAFLLRQHIDQERNDIDNDPFAHVYEYYYENSYFQEQQIMRTAIMYLIIDIELTHADVIKKMLDASVIQINSLSTFSASAVKLMFLCYRTIAWLMPGTAATYIKKMCETVLNHDVRFPENGIVDDWLNLCWGLSSYMRHSREHQTTTELFLAGMVEHKPETTLEIITHYRLQGVK